MGKSKRTDIQRRDIVSWELIDSIENQELSYYIYVYQKFYHQ